MFGFICLEGCQRADTFIHQCGYMGRHREIHVVNMNNEQLNAGDGVILVYLKANIVEKEGGWHINNDCRTAEYTFS